MPSARIPLEPAVLFDALRRVAVCLGTDLYVVGGYLRDALLGRASFDVDVITPYPQEMARRLAAEIRGHEVELDAQHGIYRVVDPSGAVVDLARPQAETLEADLAQRDLTINAIALPLVLGGAALAAPELVDPTGGYADLRAGTIRTPAVENLLADPVRLLRVFRFAAVLGFAIDYPTLEWVEIHRRRILDSASERWSYELFKILALPDSIVWVERLFGMGILVLLVPETGMLAKLPPDAESWPAMARALETLRTLEGLLRDWPPAFAELVPDLEAALAAPVAGGVTQGALLKLGALLLEIGRPFTQRFEPGGEKVFDPHAAESGKRAENIAERLKLSARARELLGTWCRLQDAPEAWARTPTDPVSCYRAFKTAKGTTVGVVLLAIARQRAHQVPTEVAKHFEVAMADVLRRYFDPQRRYTEPQRLVDGRDLMQALGLKPGRAVGELLEAVLEAQLRGEFRDRDAALEWARTRAGP